MLGPALDIPSSLSAVFDSSDEDDLAASEDTALYREDKGPGQTRGSVTASTAAAIVNPELFRLADEYREAGLGLLHRSPVQLTMVRNSKDTVVQLKGTTCTSSWAA